MKPILSKIISLTPFIIAIAIAAYIVEEIMEDRVSELASDFVYPIAGLIILAVVWIYLVPTIQAYLNKSEE